MKSEDRYTYGPCVSYWHDGSPPSVESRMAYRNNVSHSAIIHGNMKDPNAWSYATGLFSHWKGSTSNVNITGHPDWSYERVGCIGESFNLSPPAWERSAVYNRALAKLSDQVRGDLDLGVDIAEAGQVRRMFQGLREAEALAQVVGSGLSRTAANGWLQYQYGWRPLYQDLWGAANESLNIVLNILKKFKVSASQPLWGQYSEPASVDGTVYTCKRNTSGKASCTIQCEIELPGLAWDRFSSLNPVSLAWEVIPYSFVIDWVFDVGTFLRSFETACLYNSRFKSGFISELYRGRADCHVSDTVISGIYRRTAVVDGWVRGSSFQRTPLTSFPLPRTPSFQARMGWQRWLSAGSLMRQVMR